MCTHIIYVPSIWIIDLICYAQLADVAVRWLYHDTETSRSCFYTTGVPRGTAWKGSYIVNVCILKKILILLFLFSETKTTFCKTGEKPTLRRHSVPRYDGVMSWLFEHNRKIQLSVYRLVVVFNWNSKYYS